MSETVTYRSQAKNPAGLRRFTFPAPLSFFWKFLAPNDLPGGANSFYRGARGLSPGYWATGDLSPNGGATGSCRPVAGRQAPGGPPPYLPMFLGVEILQKTPCRPATGRQGSCRPVVGRQVPCRPVAG